MFLIEIVSFHQNFMKYGTIIILNMHVWGITKSIKNERSEICSPTFTDSKSLINDNFNFTCFFLGTRKEWSIS